MDVKKYDLLLGSVMKAYRKKCKLTQSEVAKMANCTRFTISRLENGNTHSDDIFIMKLCDIYHEDYVKTMQEIYNKMD